MINELEILIKELETEKENLLRLINDAVNEQEFLSAHFHSEALAQINGRLQTLKNFDDKLYDQKYFKAISIENLKRRLESETSEQLRAMIIESIANAEEELKKLSEIPKKRNENKSNVINDHLELLANRKINGFRIVLNKKNDLMLEIRRLQNSQVENLRHFCSKLKA